MDAPLMNPARGSVYVRRPVLAAGVLTVVAATVVATLALNPAHAGGSAAPKFAAAGSRHHHRGSVRYAEGEGEGGASTGAPKPGSIPAFSWTKIAGYDGKYGYEKKARKGPKPGEIPAKYQAGAGVMRYEPAKYGEDTGVLPPTGFFDPPGFSRAASPARLRWFKEAELKHGRIAMLAALGFCVAENADLKDAFFPGMPTSALASRSLVDHQVDGFWAAFVSIVGVLEARYMNDKMASPLDWKLKDDYAVGDLGWDPLGLKPEDPESFAKVRTEEIQNGRLAMLAIAGFNAQEMTDGKPLFPIHGLEDAASAAEVDAHVQQGLHLVKEMGQMLMETRSN